MGRLRLQPHFEFSDRMVVGLYIYLPVELTIFICQVRVKKEALPFPGSERAEGLGHNTHTSTKGLSLIYLYNTIFRLPESRVKYLVHKGLHVTL